MKKLKEEKIDMFDFFANISDLNISMTEKAGRYKNMKDKEVNIFGEIEQKLNLSNRTNILDIGCGCGILAKRIIDFAQQENINLSLNDSSNIINHLKEEVLDSKNIKFIKGRFPDILIEKNSIFDAIILYSVIHYVEKDKLLDFIDSALKMLQPGGSLLIGDIPNIDKKNRFNNSTFGKSFNMRWKKNQELCYISHNYPSLDLNYFNDSLIFSIINHIRTKKCFDAYILPQSPNLPFGYIREDILISKC